MPPYYSNNPPKLSTAHVAKFAQETLFYIFYSMPGDEAQVFAADELCHRGWWFHKEHKVLSLHLSQVFTGGDVACLALKPGSLGRWQLVNS